MKSHWIAYLDKMRQSEFVDAMQDDEVCTWTDKEWMCRFHMKRWNDTWGEWEIKAVGYSKGREYKAWIYPDGTIQTF